MEGLIIRQEAPSDYIAVEELVRDAFWNLYTPGCNEHYLVHKLRDSEDFISQLNFVALKDGNIVGHILYTHSQIVSDDGAIFPTITFGPLSVSPKYQRQGIGGALITHSANVAKQLGYKAIVIYGYPEYYKQFGFVQSKVLNVTDWEGKFPYAMQILELTEGALSGVTGKFSQNEALFFTDANEVEIFDSTFAPKEKAVTQSQKDFEVACLMYL